MDSGTPSLSVVIPAHNRGDLLRRALLSLAEQSERDFETIVVDDGSSEDLSRITAGFDAALGVRLLATGGKGGNAARNMGTDAARGSHVCYLDSDDIFLPGKIASTLAYVRAHDPDILVTPGFVWRGEDRLFVKPHRPPADGEDISDYYFSADQRFITSTFVVRTSAARAVRWDEALRKVQDPDFMIRLVRAGYRLSFDTDNQTVLFDDEQGGRVTSAAREANMRDWLARDDARLTPRARASFRMYALSYEVALRNRLAGAGLVLREAVRPRVSKKLAAKALVRILLSEASFKRAAQRSLRGDRGVPRPDVAGVIRSLADRARAAAA